MLWTMAWKQLLCGFWPLQVTGDSDEQVCHPEVGNGLAALGPLKSPALEEAVIQIPPLDGQQ